MVTEIKYSKMNETDGIFTPFQFWKGMDIIGLFSDFHF